MVNENVALCQLSFKSQQGISLIEIITAAFILLTIVISIGYMFATGRGNIDGTGNRRAALTAVMEKVEQLMDLPYNDLDLTPGNHDDPSNPIVIDNRGTIDIVDDLKGFLRWNVVNFDDKANGEGNSDYKIITVTIYEDALYINEVLHLQTIFSP
ncbi:MAG: hypothetical protein SWO11_18415 [Thermodesulfobacteriota bacterium]|nr:hypothetical protein [Thermodesulfobacteriota bacterium]